MTTFSLALFDNLLCLSSKLVSYSCFYFLGGANLSPCHFLICLFPRSALLYHQIFVQFFYSSIYSRIWFVNIITDFAFNFTVFRISLQRINFFGIFSTSFFSVELLSKVYMFINEICKLKENDVLEMFEISFKEIQRIYSLDQANKAKHGSERKICQCLPKNCKRLILFVMRMQLIPFVTTLIINCSTH